MVETFHGTFPVDEFWAGDPGPNIVWDDDGWRNLSFIEPPVQGPTPAYDLIGTGGTITTPPAGCDATGFLHASWVMDQTALLQTLAEFGFVGTRLALQSGDEECMLQQMLAHLQLSIDPHQFQWHLAHLMVATQRAVAGVPLQKRLRGDNGSAGWQRLSDFIAATTRQMASSSSVAEVAFVCPAKGKRRLRLKLEAGIEVTSEEFERAESAKYRQLISDILQMADAPLILEAFQSSSPANIVAGAMGATRVGTLRQYYKSIRNFLDWLFVTSEIHWPACIAQPLDYLHMRLEEPCSPSIPSTFGKALAWFEKTGGFQLDRSFSGNGLFKRTLDYASNVAGANQVPSRQSPRPPAALVAAFELYVCDVNQPKLKRLKAWTWLLKCYCTLREDDLTHIAPKSLRVIDDLISATLMRTKTSGPSKKIKELPLALWMGSTITGEMWLENGLGLLDEVGASERSYLLPSPNRDFSDGKLCCCSYSKSAAMTQAIIREIKIPIYEDGRWKSSDTQLIPSELIGAFTEHGPRSFLPSILAFLETLKEQRDMLGRWSPTGSDDYVRSFRLIVKKLQQTAVEAIRSGDSRLIEGDILDRVLRFGEDRDIKEAPELIKLLRANLCIFEKEIERAFGGLPSEVNLVPLPVLNSAIDEANEELLTFQRGMASNAKARTRVDRSNTAKWLIVYSKGRRHARLHKIGSNCPWAGVQVKDCSEHVVIQEHLYDSRCKICFPTVESDTSNSDTD